MPRSRQSNKVSFGRIVRRFQDMAFGCAYAWLGDVEDAQDAAQDAFIEAWQDLGKLRDPAAFPGWFRRIVHKRADRHLRARKPAARGDSLEHLSPKAAITTCYLGDMPRGVEDEAFANVGTIDQVVDKAKRV